MANKILCHCNISLQKQNAPGMFCIMLVVTLMRKVGEMYIANIQLHRLIQLTFAANHSPTPTHTLCLLFFLLKRVYGNWHEVVISGLQASDQK